MNLSLILQITSTTLVVLGYLIYLIKKIIEKAKLKKIHKMELKIAKQKENQIKEELYKEYLKKKGE